MKNGLRIRHGEQNMAKWHYRKSVKVLPGIRVNLSSKGVGFSAGVPGARVTLSPNKKRVTLTQSIPGTGFRKQQSIRVGNRLDSNDQEQVSGSTNLFKDPIFIEEYSKLKGFKYKFHKFLFLLNFIMFIGIALLVQDENSPLGGVAAINFFILIYAFPAFFVIRSRLVKEARYWHADRLSKLSAGADDGVQLEEE
jgi:hypothetical protein